MVLVGISNSMLFVILPLLARHMQTGEMYVGLIFAGSAFLYMFFSPFWGWRSDNAGRRPVLLLGILGNGFSLLGMALVAGWILQGAIGASWALLLLALSRVVYGLVGSSMQPAAQGYVADRTVPRERTMLLSLLAAGAGLGASIGPPMAAIVSHLWSAPTAIYLLIGLSALIFVLIAIGLPEHQRPERKLVTSRQMLGLVFEPKLRALLFMGTMIWMAHGVFLQTMHFFVSDRLGLSSEQALPWSGSILAMGAFAMLLVQFVAIPWLKPSPRILIITGIIAALLGAIGMILTATVIGITAAYIMAATGFGLVRPGLSGAASLRTSVQEQGGAAGLMTATAGAGFVLAPFTGLALYQFAGSAATYLLLVGTLSVTLLVSLRQPADPLPQPAREPDAQ